MQKCSERFNVSEVKSMDAINILKALYDLWAKENSEQIEVVAVKKESATTSEASA